MRRPTPFVAAENEALEYLFKGALHLSSLPLETTERRKLEAALVILEKRMKILPMKFTKKAMDISAKASNREPETIFQTPLTSNQTEFDSTIYRDASGVWRNQAHGFETVPTDTIYRDQDGIWRNVQPGQLLPPELSR
jgi:hypothetical protein